MFHHGQKLVWIGTNGRQSRDAIYIAPDVSEVSPSGNKHIIRIRGRGKGLNGKFYGYWQLNCCDISSFRPA